MTNESHLSLGERAPWGVAAITVDAVFVSLAAAALGVRLTSRDIQGRRLCLNDWAALLAWPFAAGLVVITVINVVRGGSGQHIQELSPAIDKLVIIKLIPASTIIYNIAITLVKVALLHFYLTIFGLDKTFRKVTYTVMAIIVGLGIGWCLEAVLICRPLRKDWDPQTPGVCGSNKNGVLVGGILNVITDFAIIALPIPMVWRLQMAPQRKIALTFVFGLGFIVCGVSILRSVVGSRLDLDDFTYSEAKVDIITHLEAFLAIIVACLPIFPPTLKRMLRGKIIPDTRNVISSSVARLRSKGSKPRKFRKFDDLYPLTDLEGGTGTRDEINGLDSKSTSSLNDPMSIKRAVHPQSTTNVKSGP